MKRIIFYTVIVLFSLLSATSIVAKPLLGLARSITMPNDVIVDNRAIAQYTVTNNSPINLSAVQLVLPTGITQITGNSLCNFPAALASGASCTLQVAYTPSSTSSQFNDASFKVCPDSSQQLCSTMSATQAHTTSVVAEATSDMPTLSLSSSTLTLSASTTTTLTVTNTSSTVTANDIRIGLPGSITTYLESTSTLSCASTAPGATCTLRLIAKSTLPGIAATSVTIEGSNTQSSTVTVSATSGNATAASVTFSSPSTQNLTITNESTGTITVTDVTLGDGINNVTVGSIPSSCEDVASEATCNVPLTAATNAYGSGTATITYTAGISKTTTAAVTVANTTVSINGGNNISGNSVVGSGTFTIENTGNFTWQGISVTRDSSDSSWLTLTTTGVGYCTTDSTLAPGQTCTVGYSMTFPNDAASSVTATGTNISDTSVNFAPDEYISIGEEANSDYAHLAYKAIKITNLTLNTLTLSDVSSADPIADKIITCNSTGSNCSSDFASDCLTASKQLTSGASCHIWYHALPGSSIETDNDTVDVSATATPSGGSGNTLTRSVTFNYSQDLYAGGSFALNPESTPVGYYNGVARYNADGNWYGLSAGENNGVTGTVYALHLDLDGDLIVGGSFTSAGGSEIANLALWNGNTWSQFSGASNTPDDTVYTIIDEGENIYIGGSFRQIGATSVSSVAEWDGSTWTNIGTLSEGDVVYALNYMDGYLYAAGAFNAFSFFNTIYKLNLNSIVPTAPAQLSTGGTAGVQIASESDFPGTVYALTNDSNYIYVGGDFTKAGNVSTNYVARWENSGDSSGTWTAIAGTGALQSGDIVRALLSSGDDLYVGGTIAEDSENNLPAGIRVKDLVGDTWSAIGDGAGGVNDGGEVDAIVKLGSNIYIGGEFNAVGPGATTAYNIARWNGSSWSTLDEGLNAKVQALLAVPRIASISFSVDHRQRVTKHRIKNK